MLELSGFEGGQAVAAAGGVLYFVLMLCFHRLAKQPSLALPIIGGLQFWGYVAIAEVVVHASLKTEDDLQRIMFPVMGVCVAALIVRAPYVWAYHRIKSRATA